MRSRLEARHGDSALPELYSLGTALTHWAVVCGTKNNNNKLQIGRWKGEGLDSLDVSV